MRGKSVLPVAAGLLLSGMLAFTTACGDDDDDGPSAEEIGEVEDIATRAFESSAENADFLFAHVTDNWLETVFFASREECQANAADCIGEPAAVEAISDTRIDGDTATTVVTSDFGRFQLGLVREGGAWKVDSLRAASDEVPGGAKSVELALAEFYFTFDEADIPADGNLAFRVRNGGAQVHEVVVVNIPEGVELMEALESVGTEEVAPVAFKVFIMPGQEVDMAFEEPFEPGKYALVCFFPDTDDPEFLPHIEKGMIATFIVGG